MHYSLAAALRSLGKLDEAIAEYREAIRLKPDYPEAHCDLGNTLVQQGLFAEGVAALPSRSRDGIKERRTGRTRQRSGCGRQSISWNSRKSSRRS